MRINCIPMAGEGRRFKAAGFSLPKPMVSVSAKPMVVQACCSLPSADKWIFICRSEHCRDFGLDQVLKENFNQCEIITVDYLTEGEAATCMLAADLIGDEEQLLIGACDNGMRWDKQKYRALIDDQSIDALIWTFRGCATVRRNPAMYGWVVVDNAGRAQRVSCKIPISENPVNDQAIVGTFYFRKGKYFKDAAREMFAKNKRINNEFYVDQLINELIEAAMKVLVFEIDTYVCWGTPDDLRTYEYWQRYFHRASVEALK